MKNNKFLSTSHLFIAILIITLGSSCENEFKAADVELSKSPPVVSSIRTVVENQEVSQGVLRGSYMLEGQHLSSLRTVHFNGTLASFNPAFLSDDRVFVNVPADAPLRGSNIMKVESLGGVLEIDFPLLGITGFSEGILDNKKVVILEGGGFDYSPTVFFNSGSTAAGTLVEREANVVSFTDTTITAEVPDGVVQAFIFVNTSRGASAVSESYGFNLPVYIDELDPNFQIEGWGGDEDYFATEQALGATSIKKNYDAFGGLKWRAVDPISTSEYSRIVFKIYGGANASKVRLSFNDLNNNDIGIVLDVNQGEWNSYSIALNDPNLWNGVMDSEIEVIVLQELSAVAADQYIIYLDDFGFLE